MSSVCINVDEEDDDDDNNINNDKGAGIVFEKPLSCLENSHLF